MGLFKKIKQKWNDWYFHDLDDEPFEEWDSEERSYDDDFFHDKEQRKAYVYDELGKMAEAAEKMEEYQAEYDAVKSLLVDMEEIEQLPINVKHEIMKIAEDIENQERQRRIIISKPGTLTENEVEIIERHEDELEGAISKMHEAEDYRKLINSDLRRLDDERNYTHYRKRELKGIIANSKGIASICAIAMIVCLIGLAVLQFVYEMDVVVGYLIIAGAGAISLTVIYVRHLNASSELTRLSKTINKLIIVHNTVKIRYINNTNLLQYMYMKYDVDSADELEERFHKYIEEENARNLDERLKRDLERNYRKLTDILQKNSIKDPDIWIHQAKALYDKREMVEVRHALIGRRQKLREQLEYNSEIANTSKENIKNLGKNYPKYLSEISEIVNNYEGIE